MAVYRDGKLVTGSPSPFEPEQYDYILFEYTSSNVTHVTYKTGGTSGIISLVLNLAYDTSNEVISVSTR